MITRRLARPAGQISASSASSSSPPWTCPACRRRPSLLQTVQKSPSRRTYAALAGGHTVPKLHHHDHFSQNGVPNLYTGEGYAMAWTEYQKGLVAKLNELVSGTDVEHLHPKDLVFMFARDPMNASIFNYASAACNNHFYMTALSTHSSALPTCTLLHDSLLRTFGTVENLRSTMLDTAAAMFGPGYVWLVWARNVDPSNRTAAVTPRSGSWRILTTYLAGTPYPEAGFRQQGVDMNNQNPASYQNYLSQQSSFVNNSAGAFGALSFTGKNEARIPPGGTSLVPVLCVSTWEHSYLRDFGVNGRRQFLSTWWDNVDWNAVEENMPSEAKTSTVFRSRLRGKGQRD